MERFWAKVNKTETCWLWAGSTDRGGYGRVRANRKMLKAHRVVWMLHYGSIPVGFHVLHHCDNPPCVRPAHLFLGTQADNMRDCQMKGRKATGERNGNCTHPEQRPRGECHKNSKLTETRIQAIRALYASGVYTQAVLGRQFGVCQAAISYIVRRKQWTHCMTVMKEEPNHGAV